ncbi:unnamed protein product [Symbiodinium natans]|uniref:Uncharacterized protein n=1 Tax=Symbiodinium natans TaxID=878477 RepID=A0A812QIS0_9DINO|nr:unnamed protein product [Symbiodinium natans]
MAPSKCTRQPVARPRQTRPPIGPATGGASNSRPSSNYYGQRRVAEPAHGYHRAAWTGYAGYAPPCAAPQWPMTQPVSPGILHRASEPALELPAHAKAVLETHSRKLEDQKQKLCPVGQRVFSALRNAMSQAASEQWVEFERAFRQHLARCRLGLPSLERVASGQWSCSLAGRDFLVSLRTEVLADGQEANDFLARLKQEARRVRGTLFEHGAWWMKSLVQGLASKEDFLKQCRVAWPQGCAGLSRSSGREDACEWCGCSKASSHLAGSHLCRVMAQFCCESCSSKWWSVQARFDPQQERVLGQKCKFCELHGLVLAWCFSEPQDVLNSGTKYHRSDLCEACGRFGNCQGAFFEPFIMSAAIELLARKPWWYTSGGALLAQAGPFFVTMLPHVVSTA